MTGVLRTTIERDKEAIEAMQQRLEELGAPRMTEEELDAKATEAPSEASALPQPKGRWRNGKYLMYEPETGQGTDTHHETLEDALSQAQWEFNVLPSEWIKTERPYA